jgi:flagellar basal-body rod protein FlgF
MLRGIYTAAAGMNSIQLGTDTMANNLANIGTAGFKTSRVQYQAFPAMLMNRLGKGANNTGGDDNQPIGDLNTGVQVSSTPLNYTQGSLHQTGNPLDVAINGDALFSVKTGNGQTAYTRNGSFTLSDDHQLVTHEGYAVLGTDGNPITIEPDAGELTISAQGVISSLKQGEIGTLQRVKFEDARALVKLSDSLLTGENPQVLAPNEGGTVQQGFLENSNTNVVGEMIQSITGMRLYETLQRSISTQNATLEKTVNQIGKP